MPGSIFGFPTRPTTGQGMLWTESLGGRHDVGSFTGATLTGFTDNRVPFGSAAGGLEDSANLTFNGTALALSGTLAVSGTITGISTVAITPTMTPAAGQDARGLYVKPTVTEASSGTHAILAGAYFDTPTINAGAASVTDAVTLYIQGHPSAAGATNLALYVGSGMSRLRDNVIVGNLTSTADVLRVRGPSGSDWALHVDTAPGQAASYGTWLESNTGVSDGYPILKVTDNGGGNEWFKVETGGTSYFKGVVDIAGVTKFRSTVEECFVVETSSAYPTFVLKSTDSGTADEYCMWKARHEDAGGNVVDLGYFVFQISDATDTSEDARFKLATMRGGALYDHFLIREGRAVFGEASLEGKDDGIRRLQVDGDARVNGTLLLVDGMSAPSTAAGYACIYVDSGDGDLKVKFGDGTVKTLATDT